MGKFILTQEDEAFLSEKYNKTGVYIGNPIDWDASPAKGRVIGTAQSEKYECGDTIKFDSETLVEVEDESSPESTQD